MKSLVTLFATFLFATACCVLLVDAQRASADCVGCGTPGTCAWRPGGPFNADNTNGDFSFNATMDWCVNGTVQGVFFEFVSVPTDNIDDDTVMITPSSIGAQACSGSQTVTVDGELDSNCMNGTVKLKNTVWFNGTGTCVGQRTYSVHEVCP
jgi:hypothetical protein